MKPVSGSPFSTSARHFFAALFVILALAFGFVLAAPAAAGDTEARLLRYPTIHRDFVVFVYAGDLWRASSNGGRAWRLTSHEGLEYTPKISPDGEWVAYSAEYSGTRQVYVIPATGGEPRQLTYYNDVGVMPPRGGFDYWVQGWRPDGQILVRMNRTPYGQRPGRYFLVDPEGGLETPLPLPVAGGGSYSDDGTKLAYTYFDREFRTWKRYKGGRNQDIWTFDLEAMQSKRLTDWAGTDNFPMWRGNTIYFTSDRDETLNLFALDLATNKTRKLTDFNEYDVLWPSIGPDSIVFMNGGWLYRLDLESETSEKISITIGNDLPATVPHWEDASDNIAEADISPDGKRAVFEARGDLFSVPAKDGATRNLSDTQGVRESSPAWSPDGRSIAYYSDVSGEMELFVRSQDGTGEARQLTEGSSTWRFPPVWSPDSKKIVFGDSDHRLHIIDVAGGTLTLADTGTQADIDTYRWSPDSNWIAYEKNHPETTLPSLAIYSLASKTVEILGDGTTFDFEPTWSSDGTYLFFLSNRDYNLNFSDFEFNYVYDNATRVYAVALTSDADPLFPPISDEVAIETEDKKSEPADAKAKKKGKASDDDADEAADKPLKVRVEAEGFADRTIALSGLDSGNYADLAAVDGAVIYRKIPEGGDPTLMRYSLEDREEKEITANVAEYILGAKGDKILYRWQRHWSIVDAKPGATGEQLGLSGLRMKLEPKAEWAQMFDEAWRIGRDWFYDEKMHGIDWDGMKERYGALVPFIAHRSDLDFIFGEMVAELEAGHTYVQNGEMPEIERVAGGMLGAEFKADQSGYYRFAKVFQGENWDDAYRSPLTEPGVGVAEGDYLFSIDGHDVTTTDNPFRFLEGKGNQQVKLSVGSSSDPAKSREVTVRTITSEGNLRYIDWVLSRAELVNELSGGRIGYLHLPNTAGAGNRMLQKMFYSQASKEALIIDERYNGGGFIPGRMIEMLGRTTLSYWARRGVQATSTPGFAHNGPKVMLINGYAASGGDALPYYFRKRGLGTLIGTTTWGGLIGISGNPMLVDDGGVLYPTFRFFSTEGEWVVEGVGVAPDIEVWDLPEAIAAGGDPSIEKAVETLLEQLESFEGEPEEPETPDMSQP
jgi:tricorn protease